MATEPTSVPVNGNYGAHQQYSAGEPNLSSQAPNHADALAPAAGAFGAQNANVHRRLVAPRLQETTGMPTFPGMKLGGISLSNTIQH
jgi:hypothetical protein